MSSDPVITEMWPTPRGALSDADIIEGFAAPRARWLSANFVSSVDGGATRDGLSGGLGGAGDKRLFDLLRRPADAILVGAGTVRAEGYGPMRLSGDAVAWREAAGLPAHPVFAIASGSLDLDVDSPVFADAPVRPVVIGTSSAPASKRESVAAVADLVDGGKKTIDGAALVDGLRERGLDRIHHEGGPSLFSTLLDADVVDELFLTLSPVIVGGDGPRIVAGSLPTARELQLHRVLASDGALLLQYRRLR